MEHLGFMWIAPPRPFSLRLRTPVAYAGKLAAVTVGGQPWVAIDAKAETISFTLLDLTPALLRDLCDVVATYK